MHNLSIRLKIIFPIVIFLIIAMSTALFLLNNMVDQLQSQQSLSAKHLMTQTMSDSTKIKVADIYGVMQQIGSQAVEQVSSLASIPGVVDAFKTAHLGDMNRDVDPYTQQARDTLRTLFKPIIKKYSSTTKQPLFLHFHLPTGRSLVRLWREGWQAKRNGQKVDISDDLSGFRKSVLQINNGSKTTLQGIEVGRGGFAIRGLTTVVDKDNKQLGSAEILRPFNDILAAIKTSPLQDFAIYMNADLLSVATKLQNPSKYPVLNGQYVLCSTTNKQLPETLISSRLLDKGKKGLYSEQMKNRYVSAFPITDFSSQQVGVMVMSQDISEALSNIETMETNGKNVLKSIQIKGASGAAIMTALLALIILYIVTSMTRPVTAIVEMVQELEKGNFDYKIKIPEQQNDEIGKIARALNSLSKTMKHEILAAFDALASGDLTFESHGVIQNPLAKTNEALNRVMSQIKRASGEIDTAATEIANTSQSLSQGVIGQAASLEQMASSLNEVTAQTETNADNAEQANQLTTEAMETAEQGQTQMQEMIAAMSEIDTAGQNISKIIKTIDEIAFQTNLLALNAAVEAARAGQHGKGFAVVAEEVRNLAARSAKAAAETAELIAGTVEKTQNGSIVADKTANHLKNIVDVINKAKSIAAEIAAASRQQAQKVKDINDGISRMSDVNQQNTAISEESAAAAEELSGQAAQLDEMLKSFTLKEPSEMVQAPRLQLP